MTIRLDQMPPAVRAEYDRLAAIKPPQSRADIDAWCALIQFWDDGNGVFFTGCISPAPSRTLN